MIVQGWGVPTSTWTDQWVFADLVVADFSRPLPAAFNTLAVAVWIVTMVVVYRRTRSGWLTLLTGLPSTMVGRYFVPIVSLILATVFTRRADAADRSEGGSTA